MTQFSPRSAQAIHDFVAQLQMPPIQPASDGSYSIAFERAGLLTFTASDDGKRAILSLKQPARQRFTGEDLKHVLSLARRDAITRAPISVGVAGDGGVIFAANIQNEDFDLQKIEACLDRLIDLHAAV